MIVSYCKKNKVAITFETKTQFLGIIKLFRFKYRGPAMHKGILTFYRGDIEGEQCIFYVTTDNHLFDWHLDFTKITALEFFAMMDPKHSILGGEVVE